MMYLLKAAAAVLVLVTATCVSREYKKFEENKLSLYEGLLSLLAFIKTELSCRGRAVTLWAPEFENVALYETGFISALRECGNVHSAFLSHKDKFSPLGSENTGLIERYFSSFGKSYRDEEEGEACRVFDAFSAIFEEEKKNSDKSVKVVRTISYAVGLGVIILLL